MIYIKIVSKNCNKVNQIEIKTNGFLRRNDIKCKFPNITRGFLMRVPANAASTAPIIQPSPRRVSIRGLAVENNRSRITAFRDDAVRNFGMTQWGDLGITQREIS